MRMYGVKHKDTNQVVAVVKANTSAQAVNVLIRREKTKLDASVLKPEDVYEHCVKGSLPLIEPETAELQAAGEASGDGADSQ